MSKNLVSLVIGLVAMAVVGLSASADGGPPYRRTTPRGSFGADGPQLVVGVPGGRAWGIESGLVPVPDGRAGFRATLEVSDPLVREAFEIPHGRPAPGRADRKSTRLNSSH